MPKWWETDASVQSAAPSKWWEQPLYKPKGPGDWLGLGLRGLAGLVGVAPGVGALASGIVEMPAQFLEKTMGSRESYNPWQIGTQAALGAIPMRNLFKTVKSAKALASMKGGVLGSGGAAATELTDQIAEGEFDIERLGRAAGRGLVVGAGGGLITGAAQDRFARRGKTPAVPRTNVMDDAGDAASRRASYRQSRGYDAPPEPTAPVAATASSRQSSPLDFMLARQRPLELDPDLAPSVQSSNVLDDIDPPMLGPAKPERLFPPRAGSMKSGYEVGDELNVGEPRSRRSPMATPFRSSKPESQFEVLDPDIPAPRLNASGESAASAEAMSRAAGMKSRGEQFVVYDRAGQKKILIGPDAVDYPVHSLRQGETYGIETKDGRFKPLDDRGGRFPKATMPAFLQAEPKPTPDLEEAFAHHTRHEIGFAEDNPDLLPWANKKLKAAVNPKPSDVPFGERAAETNRQQRYEAARDTDWGFTHPDLLFPLATTATGAAAAPILDTSDRSVAEKMLLGAAVGASTAYGARKIGNRLSVPAKASRLEQLGFEVPPGAEYRAKLPAVPSQSMRGEKFVSRIKEIDQEAANIGNARADLDKSRPPIPRDAGFVDVNEIGKGTNQLADLLNRARYFSMLARVSAQGKNVAGASGSTLLKAAELAASGNTKQATAVLRHVFSRETLDRMASAFRNPPKDTVDIGGTRHGPTSGVLGIPSRMMAAVDEGVTGGMERAGVSREAAKEALLTSNPKSETGKWLSKAPALVRLPMPFVRTATNLVERGLEHTPGVGALPAVRKMRNPTRQQLIARQSLGALAAAAGLAAGGDNAYFGALMGPLGIPYAGAAATKEAWKRKDDPVQAFADTIRNSLPLPTDAVDYDLGRWLSQFVPGILTDLSPDRPGDFKQDGLLGPSIAKIPFLNSELLQRKRKRRPARR